MKKFRELLTRKNIGNALFIVLIIVLIASPRAKALLIRGLMEIGLMRPPTKSEVVASSRPAVDIGLSRSDGTVLHTGQLKGKVLLINFWATWCPPCIAEMPSINRLYLRYKNNSKLLIIPVDADNDLQKSMTFMRENGFSLPVYTLSGQLPSGLVSNAIPTTLIIDKNGRVVARHEGAADYASKAFYDYLDTLLNE